LEAFVKSWKAFKKRRGVCPRAAANAHRAPDARRTPPRVGLPGRGPPSPCPFGGQTNIPFGRRRPGQGASLSEGKIRVDFLNQVVHVLGRESRREAMAAARAGGVALVRMPWNAPLRSDPNRHVRSVLKAVSSDREALLEWCRARGIPTAWVQPEQEGGARGPVERRREAGAAARPERVKGAEGVRCDVARYVEVVSFELYLLKKVCLAAAWSRTPGDRWCMSRPGDRPFLWAERWSSAGERAWGWVLCVGRLALMVCIAVGKRRPLKQKVVDAVAGRPKGGFGRGGNIYHALSSST